MPEDDLALRAGDGCPAEIASGAVWEPKYLLVNPLLGCVYGFVEDEGGGIVGEAGKWEGHVEWADRRRCRKEGKNRGGLDDRGVY